MQRSTNFNARSKREGKWRGKGKRTPCPWLCAKKAVSYSRYPPPHLTSVLLFSSVPENVLNSLTERQGREPTHFFHLRVDNVDDQLITLKEVIRLQTRSRANTKVSQRSGPILWEQTKRWVTSGLRWLGTVVTSHKALHRQAYTPVMSMVQKAVQSTHCTLCNQPADTQMSQCCTQLSAHST